MKPILTIAIVLSLLMPAAYADTPAEKPNEVITAAQHEKHIELCTQNLAAIGAAIQTYQKVHNDLPEWLSDLHPKHLADANLLICPADTRDGQPVFTSNTDPKMSVSYGYQFHPKYRTLKNEQRSVYGDAIPLVRCRHHENQGVECLNLSFSYKVYTSSRAWEYTPEDMYGSHAAAISAFEKTLEKHPHDTRFSELYLQLVRLYVQIENEGSANAIIQKFKSTMPFDMANYITISDMLETMGRYEEILEVLKEAEHHDADDRSILRRFARTHKRLGNLEIAKEYERKADPTYELIGKVVPDFSATDLDGNPISLQDYRGKVVLLDFWAVWCAPCIAEMPNLKKVYNTYKDQGFDIIGISLDTDETKLRNYLKDNDIPWRQVFSTEEYPNPIAVQYRIRAIPAPWLIDREGKLITHKAKGTALEKHVAAALKPKPTNK